MVCLEVVFKTGVPVRSTAPFFGADSEHSSIAFPARETPSRKAKTVATLKCGLVKGFGV